MCLPINTLYTGVLKQCYCILVNNTTFDYNFISFSMNVTKVGVLNDNVGIDKLHKFGCYGNHFGGKNDKFLSYQNVRIYKMGWRSINAIAGVLNHYIIGKSKSSAFL